MRRPATILALSSLLSLVAATPAAWAATQPELDAQWSAGQIPFRDVARENPFFDAITKLKTLRLTQGTGQGFFEPDRCASKAEVVKFALDAATVPVGTVGSTAFADVPAGWQRNYVETARSKGMLPQVDVSFLPNACASRIFTLLVILRASAIATPAVTSTTFTDVTAPEQMAAVEVARAKSIVSGRSATSFAPYEPTLRKEMAKILANSTPGGTTTPPANDRRPDFDTAVRIQTILDNFGTVLAASNVASSGAPVITRFSFVSLEFAYVQYTEGSTAKQVLLSITKPDENFRIAVLASWAADGSGALQLATGTDTKKGSAVTVYAKEGTLWLKQAEVQTSTEQLFTNAAGGYSLTVPKAWFFWNRGAVAPYANESDFGTVAVSETNWILAVRVRAEAQATVIATDAGSTAEEAIAGGVLRTYADGTFRAFLPFQTTKTLVFETKAGVTKDVLVKIIASLKTS